MPRTPRSAARQPAPSHKELDRLERLFREGPAAQAQALAESLTTRFPGHGFGWKVLGVLLLQAQRFAESAQASLQALPLLPEDASTHNNLGAAYLGLEQAAAAQAQFEQALQIAPGYAKAHVNLSRALRAQNRLAEAEQHYRAALHSAPQHAGAHFGLGNVLELQNQIPEAVASYRQGLALEPGNAVMHSDMLHLMSHDVHTSATDNLEAHRQFGQQFEAALRSQWAEHPNSREADRCIRVGFVSSDVYDHALANYLEPLFRLLGRRPGLELHLFFTHAKDDAVTARMRGYIHHWHEAATLSDDALEAQIRALAIDILVDVNGHTVQNRLLTFARKPAPIQISWLGYLGTTGLQAMDYYVSDPYWIPPGQLDWQFMEQLAYLPAAVVFEPNARAPAVNALPALANGHITFGSFNRHNKVNEAVLALWSMLLTQLPDARLLLGGIPEAQRAGLLQRLGAHGVAPERLGFLGRCVQTEYLAQHHQVDFCLDTFPFCGGATSAHAAWMGVPTLTLAGELPASRLGAAEMHHLGLDGFIADSIEDFVAKGLYWATHVDELAALRAGLRARFSQSPLGQTLAFADHFEAMLRHMWTRWCQGLPAQTFVLEALPTGSPAQAATEPSEAQLETLINLHARQEYAQIEPLARQLMQDFPEHGAGWKYLGSALRQLGRTAEALALHEQTVRLRPDDYEAHFNLAAELQQQGQFDAAVRSYLQALALQPNNPAAYNNLSNIFKLMGLFAQAEMYCRQALALKPDLVIAMNNLGNALHAQGRFAEAETHYRAALSHKPDWAEAHNNLAICLKDQGFGSEAKEAYRQALSLKPDWAAARSNLLYSLSLDVHTPPEELQAEHLRFGSLFEPALQGARTAHGNHRDPQRTLRIGFVSGDLYDHALANFLEPLFRGLATKPGLQLHAYYTHIYEDAVTARLRTHFAAWKPVTELSDAALAETIRADEIDILIDLSGHTAHNRMLVFARKPAPLQASYLGYLGSTGLQAMDYFVCDPFWVPPGQMDWQFSEKMAYLPSAVVFEASPHAAEVNALPALQNGHITFGSFNRPNKLNPSVIALWSRLLQAVPTARMVLGGIAPEHQEVLFRRFLDNGVDIARLTFFPRCNLKDYLALHQQVDFCLDTFPYGGGATNANAAWMGVPTLCLAGESPASRFGPSEMHALGLDSFVADSIDDFVARGVHWAQNIAALAALRTGLRARFLASPMGQTQAFADHFEGLLRGMWTRWCQGLPSATLGLDAPHASGADEAARALNNQGVECMSAQRWSEAEAALRQALALAPDYNKARVNLATLLRLQGQPEAAEQLSRQAVQHDPCDAAALIQLGNALEAQGQLSQAQACYYRADMAHEPRRAVAHSNVLYLMSHDVLVEPQHLLEEHRAFGELFEAPLRGHWQAHGNARDPAKKLRVGFVGGDFCHHAMTCFLEPAFKALSTRAQLELHAYSNRAETDAVTRRYQWYFARWTQVHGLSDAQLAAQIREDGIDILVDLSGHTARNRLTTFALKPAPLQLGWIGYLGSSGLQAMDYMLCDALWLPEAELGPQFVERLAQLPSAVVYAPEPCAPEVHPLPALADGFVTFGSFNRVSKINDAVLAMWCLLLERVPASRLLLAGIEPHDQARLSALFVAQGIAAQRLAFVPRLGTAAYLALHHQVDICLDTYPHGGGATTAHAAWMGVPTLCLAGPTAASRLGAAIMQQLGLEDFVTSSIEDFVAAGARWAHDLQRLSRIRSNLRARFVRAPLGQAQAFAQAFEASLRRMWSGWCNGLPVAHLACEAAPKHPPVSPAPLLVVSATQLTQTEFWESSALGQSMRQHMAMDPRLQISVAFENKRGLPEVFNQAMDLAADNAVLLFMHDDVWIDEPFFADTVLAGLQQFDVLGVAGNRRRLPEQPSWSFVNTQFSWDERAQLSGRVGHGKLAHGQVSAYGTTPAACALLDGVFLAAHKSRLVQAGVRFDTRFDFHFYDLDFCRSASASLQIGTWPIALTHQSGGAFGSAHWREKYAVYVSKWAATPTPTPAPREHA